MVVVGPVPGEEREREREIRVGVPERRDGGGEARESSAARERVQVGSVDRVARERVHDTGSEVHEAALELHDGIYILVFCSLCSFQFLNFSLNFS